MTEFFRAFGLVAKHTEEKICLRAFPGYASYVAKTGMFLPRGIERLFRWLPWPDRTFARRMATLAVFFSALFLALWLASGVHRFAIANLYTWATDDRVYLSLGELDENAIREIAAVAERDAAVRARLAPYEREGERLINYVMPVDIFVSEVPMYLPPGKTPGHQRPGGVDQRRYKIIFTRAVFSGETSGNGLDILRRASNKSSIVEVWVHRESGQVERILDPSDTSLYGGMPVPVF